MDDQQVKAHFRNQIGDYVGLMTRIIPEYEAGQAFLCKLIRFDRTKKIRVLDLGAGTGGLSEIVLQSYPYSSVHVFDLTREMLEICKRRLHSFNDRVSFQQGDYKTDPYGSGYDVILAGLTLHHLTPAERKSMYTLLYDALNEGGLFLSREVIIDEDPVITELHYSLWREFMESNGEDGNDWYNKHLEKDHPVTLSDQLNSLKLAGFKQLACHSRYWNFAVIGGCK